MKSDRKEPASDSFNFAGKHLSAPMPPHPLRVAQIFGDLDWGGVEALMSTILPRLNRRHFHTEAFFLKHGGRFAEILAEAKIPVHELAVRHSTSPQAVLPLRKTLSRKGPFDVVHCHMAAANKIGRLAGKLLSVPVVLVHYHNLRHSLPWRRRLAERLLRGLPDAHVMVSQAVGEAEARIQHLRTDQVVSIPNVIDLARWDYITPARLKTCRKELRKQWGIPHDAYVMGTVARLAPVKDLPAFIRGMKRLLDRATDVYGVIVGQGSEESELRKLAKTLGISSERLVFAGFRSDIPQVLTAFDVYVMSSRSEASSIALLEAFASGLPAVTTPVGGIREYLASEENALTFAMGNDAELAAQILRLRADPVLARTLGERAKARAREFDVGVIVPRYEQLYRRLWRRKRKTRS